MDEAKQIFMKYVASTSATDKYHARAERFVDDPHMAALRMAPPFSLKTHSGDQMALDDMRGKVVLTGLLGHVVRAVQGNPAGDAAHREAVMKASRWLCSASSLDKDGDAWSKFIEKNHMDWPQYRDANGALATVYGRTVHSAFLHDRYQWHFAERAGWVRRRH